MTTAMGGNFFAVTVPPSASEAEWGRLCHSQARVTRALFTRRIGFILGSVFNKDSLFNLHIITK